MSPLMYRDYRCDVYADATGAGWEGVVTGANEQSLGTFFTSHESEIRSEFHTTVNEYLAVCQERGFSPISPIPVSGPRPKVPDPRDGRDGCIRTAPCGGPGRPPRLRQSLMP